MWCPKKSPHFAVWCPKKSPRTSSIVQLIFFYRSFEINKTIQSVLNTCNEQTEQSHSKPRRWKSMLIHQGWFTVLYSQYLLASQSFEFEICILQALNMLLIRFSKDGYPVTLLPPPRRLVPSLGQGTTWVRQLRSGSCHYPTAATKCNERPSQASANPVGGKACSSTKGGLLRYIVNAYSLRKVSSLKFAYYKHSICCLYVFPREAIPSHTYV